VKIITKTGLLPYQTTIDEMEAKVAEIINGTSGDEIWLLEHEPVYTAGTSATDADLVESKFPVYKVGRGGKHTYHGPQQRIAYIILDLKRHYQPPDLKKFVCNIEQIVMDSLKEFGVESFRREGRVGIWCFDKNGNEAKIAALGIRVRKWVSFHGISININPDLSHFNGIVPCGIAEYGVTSLHQLGVNISMEQFDEVLKKNFEKLFSSTYPNQRLELDK
jgi:lipoyl(octanoyl) transferase